VILRSLVLTILSAGASTTESTPAAGVMLGLGISEKGKIINFWRVSVHFEAVTEQVSAAYI